MSVLAASIVTTAGRTCWAAARKAVESSGAAAGVSVGSVAVAGSGAGLAGFAGAAGPGGIWN
jgi:hypothetical protein